MKLEEFVTKALTDITTSIDKLSGNNYKINMPFNTKGNVEFDIAVTTESNLSGEGKAGIKVWEFVEAGGGAKGQLTNSTVSRIKFSVCIDSETKDEVAKRAAEIARISPNYSGGMFE